MNRKQRTESDSAAFLLTVYGSRFTALSPGRDLVLGESCNKSVVLSVMLGMYSVLASARYFDGDDDVSSSGLEGERDAFFLGRGGDRNG